MTAMKFPGLRSSREAEVVAMFSVPSAMIFGAAFILHWAGSGGHVPFTWQGLSILGLLCLALAVVFGSWWPARR